MEMINVRKSCQRFAASHPLASAPHTLRRLSEPYTWLWLEGALCDKRPSTVGMVLLTGLPDIFLSSIERRCAHG